MKHKEQLDYNYEIERLIKKLQSFIELTFHGDETPINEWIFKTTNKTRIRCWERKQCKEENCPAYQNETERCWLIAGTMCSGKIQGKFAQKYESCTQCDVFKETIGTDQISNLKEIIVILIYNLQLKKAELQEVLTKIKVLNGLLPICAYCKNIRDDEGYWKQIELYIRDHAEVEFSHCICPDCAKKFYPDLDLKRRG